MSPFIQAVINGCCRCASERPDWIESTASWRTSHSWKDLSVFTCSQKMGKRGRERQDEKEEENKEERRRIVLLEEDKRGKSRSWQALIDSLALMDIYSLFRAQSGEESVNHAEPRGSEATFRSWTQVLSCNRAQKQCWREWNLSITSHGCT